jgi:hypothetical protein
MTEKVSFYTTGDSFTGLVRDLWSSGCIKCAIDCLEGMSLEDAIKLCTGKLKLIGSTKEEPHELSIEEDDIATAFPLERQIKIFEDDLVECVNEIAARQRDNTLLSKLPTMEAMKYRKDKSEVNRKSINVREQRCQKLIENLSILYPVVGKSMIDLPILKIGTRLSEVEVHAVEKVSFPIVQATFEENLPPLVDLVPEKRIIGDNGFLSPEGVFYFCEHTGHRSLGDALSTFNIIPSEVSNPQAYLDDHNWIKFQLKEFQQFSDSNKFPTYQQIEKMTDYWLTGKPVLYNGRKFKTISDFLEYIEELKGRATD